ncbi:hypothetical protein ACH5RR_025843 [Cinchona calisaya]|uniref:Uncharacterized protein n=1 Tax=Cinchona calisaya TaxID=153742 RepID=A0ABD2Z0T5_9GENT
MLLEYLSLLGASLASHEILLGRNCFFNSFFKVVQDVIYVVVGLFNIVLHHSFSSPTKYILLMEALSSLGFPAAMKYCFKSYKKFSSSLALLAPSNALSSRTSPVFWSTWLSMHHS